MKAKLNRINHVLHRRLHDGDVSAMLRRTLILVAVSIWIVFMLCVLLAWSLTAHAQSPDCSGIALVQVIPNATLNVRALPGGTGQILRTVTEKNGEMRVVEERNGFLRLETGGWIVNKYLSISCWGLGTSVAVTIAPSSTQTRTPYPTPTRIASQLIYCASQPTIIEIEPGLWRVACDYR